jgi:hypothetical protein
MFSDWGTNLPKLSIIDPKPDATLREIISRACSSTGTLRNQIDTLGSRSAIFVYFIRKNILKNNCYYNIKYYLNFPWNTLKSRNCLGVWLRLFFKVFFMPKCIKIIFFYLLKIIFEISASKQSKTYNFF